MPTRVIFTGRAEQQAFDLRRRVASRVADFIAQLQAEGCAALGYRLTGEMPLKRLCVRHIGRLRIIVAFESPTRAWVVLLGPHDERDPSVDVYTELYKLVGFAPPDDLKRTKPPCCGSDNDPPVMSSEIDDLVARAEKLRRTRRP